jgi:DNA-binding XRE family transcriptional regulator
LSTWNKETIKELRKSLDLSQSEFAHKLGCRQQTISEWEQGLYTPANAYGRLLDSFSKQAASVSKFSGASALQMSSYSSKKEQEESIMSQDFDEASTFDPAID